MDLKTGSQHLFLSWREAPPLLTLVPIPLGKTFLSLLYTRTATWLLYWDLVLRSSTASCSRPLGRAAPRRVGLVSPGERKKQALHHLQSAEYQGSKHVWKVILDPLKTEEPCVCMCVCVWYYLMV